MVKKLADMTYKTARRIVIAIVGGTVLVIGVAMLVLPGPAMVVIPVGLAILGIEFAWARRFLRRIRDKGGDALQRIGWRKRKTRGDGGDDSNPVAGAAEEDPGRGGPQAG